ncbi:MAG TPA: 1-(5-phosphoribosyl)-5-[(5-phosphoribosylamino)methylideneamino]imidazole-4-carboxamide isomerase [Candidatus Saccharimonadales bacterium]|nr:1-(5-phosphoribosyl)-5-[(5-phosphoribosylamino)methylideneamino]imidazole-4-carboxamide isomerase [Candidatus Saccharimonadales bacterium]
MKILPAIDIKKGKCVRLTQGKFDQDVIYDDDPLRVAMKWEREGAKMIHLIDLDGAKNGTQENFQIIKNIAKTISIPLQVGGGIRNKNIAKELLSLGVTRVVIGTLALEDEIEFKKIIEDFSEQTVVALETKGGKLLTNGWLQESDKYLLETGLKLEKLGVTRFLYTDVIRDGMLTEPNYHELEKMKNILTMPIIASGGIAAITAIKKLKALGVEEAIIGKALYEKKFTLQEALYVS